MALKVPKFSADTDPLLLERFYREARAAAALRHANICPVFDVGDINGQHYISMAYIEGRPLSDFVDPDNPAPADQAASLVCRLADALEQAHSHGVIHRDLKPENIAVGEFVFQAATDHHFDHLVPIQIRGTPGANMFPVTQDHDPVCQTIDLIESVTDVNNPNSLAA